MTLEEQLCRFIIWKITLTTLVALTLFSQNMITPAHQTQCVIPWKWKSLTCAWTESGKKSRRRKCHIRKLISVTRNGTYCLRTNQERQTNKLVLYLRHSSSILIQWNLWQAGNWFNANWFCHWWKPAAVGREEHVVFRIQKWVLAAILMLTRAQFMYTWVAYDVWKVNSSDKYYHGGRRSRRYTGNSKVSLRLENQNFKEISKFRGNHNG